MKERNNIIIIIDNKEIKSNSYSCKENEKEVLLFIKKRIKDFS